MNKIFTLILLTVISSFGMKLWVGADLDDGKWESEANWSDGTVPTDDDSVLFDNTSDKSCTTATDKALKGIYIKSGYNGALDFTGDSLALHGSCIDSGNGGIRKNWSNIELDAVGCTLSIAASVGEVSNLCTLTVAANCKWNTYLMGKASSYAKFIMRNNSKIGILPMPGVTSMAIWLVYGGVRDMLTMDTACTLLNYLASITFQSYNASPGRKTCIGPSSVFGGPGQLIFTGQNTAKNDTIGNIVSTGTVGDLTISTGHADGAELKQIYLNGPIDWGDDAYIYGAGLNSRALAFYIGANNVNFAGTLYFGSSANGGNSRLYLGSETVTCAAFNGTTYNSSGTYVDTVNMQAATFNVAGDIDYGSRKRTVAGTSTLILSGATASTPTLLNNKFYDVYIRKTGAGTVTVADSFGTNVGGDFTIDSGVFFSKNMNIGGDVSVNGGTFNTTDDTVTVVGDLTLASGCTHTTDAETRYNLSKDGVIATTNSKAMPHTTISGSATIKDACTISRLVLPNTSIDTVKFEKRNKFTFTNCDSVDWSPTTGRMYITSDSVTVRDTLDFPASIGFSRLSWRDQVIAGTDTVRCTLADSCKSLGGNY